MGLSYTLHFYTVIPFLCFDSFTGTNYFSLQVQMAPKHDRVYSRGRSKSVAPSNRLIISSDDKCGPDYMPPGTHTTTHVAFHPTRSKPTIWRLA